MSDLKVCGHLKAQLIAMTNRLNEILISRLQITKMYDAEREKVARLRETLEGIDKIADVTCEEAEGASEEDMVEIIVSMHALDREFLEWLDQKETLNLSSKI